jgi:hypothetical protein
MPKDPEIVPDSPALVLRPEVIGLSIEHVESCLKAAEGLDQIANRKAIAEAAQLFIAFVRSKFGRTARNGSIFLSKTEITSSYAHNAGRRSESPVSDIYERWIPYLIQIGEAKLVAKEGKKEI